MKIVFAGIIGRYPWGGVTWCSLMYMRGLRDLGHDVYYLEDTCECNFDPELNAISTDPKYALGTIDRSLSAHGFGDRWCYVDYTGQHHGMSAEAFGAVCRDADLMLVLSGGCWVWRDEYLGIPLKVFIDSDPGFTQLALEKAKVEAETDASKRWYYDYFKTYDHLFTFGRNIGTPASSLPTAGFEWNHTWQPVCLDLWNRGSEVASRPDWTTVMTWEIESFEEIGGNKDQELVKVMDLPERLRDGPTLELAINGPMELLREWGWRCVPAFEVSSDLWKYRDYLQSSRGEFSVAKHTYVATNSGWFSDRTACYLASGRPAVVQDTGFSEHIQTGDGLIAWTNPEEAIDAIREVETDYARHSAAAKDVAREVFGSDQVIGQLLRACGL